jgi:hypothetical protein
MQKQRTYIGAKGNIMECWFSMKENYFIKSHNFMGFHGLLQE